MAEPVKVVLVVDDDADILRLVEAVLTGHGYSVLAAESAEKALKIFEQLDKPPDLLLTDVVMPGLSGPMLAERLRSVLPGLRVLFMSGYNDRQVVRRFVVGEGLALLPKPFTLERLESKVKEMLELQLAPPDEVRPS